MKIELKNFGPIHHFTFDLDKDLHVIYGENNVGKSYSIGAVYLILKNLRGLSDLSFFPFLYNSDNIKKIASFIIESGKISKKKELEITNQYTNLLQEVFQQLFIERLNSSLLNSFSTIQNKFNNSSISEIILTFSSLQFSIQYGKGKWYISFFHFQSPTLVKFIEGNGETASGPDNNSSNDLFVFRLYAHEGRIREMLVLHLSQMIDETITKDFIRNIHFLPASRSGLFQGLAAVSPILAKVSQMRSSLGDNSFEIPSLGEPISDYFLALSSIKSDEAVGVYADLAASIEKNVLGAEISFNSERSRLEYYNKRINLRLQLSETSSMVSEIAPIVAYLKFIVKESQDLKKGHLFFIEEPEAHLHPKVQVKMMEIFAEMIKVGIKVVMTTHSDFMLSKLTNLLLADEIDASKVSSYHMVMGKNGSYDAGNMKANEEGIEDYNFIDVTEQLYEERINLLEKQNSNASK